ncbi:hypothetical protein RclHR1_00070032 [Rhizophagus clarus]|uniref:Uncharacterized protein n=1 Tax=Rhizophagus clarus TaxID=94130 RepID=A0A2Z6S729_9GLOM|nr:hypothetical protein RclHR1_00070032 [Rhizophagus clarus]GES78205.1 hypothetical protein GLOIN_2v1771399 [Rhizophagus clarus]
MCKKLRCLYSFDEDTFEKQIIVLKPNYEFVTWALPDTSSGLNSVQLFKQHYLEALGEDLQVNSEMDAEIIEAWNCSDMQVREEYGKLCSLQDSSFTNNLYLVISFDSQIYKNYKAIKGFCIFRALTQIHYHNVLTAGKTSTKSIDRIFKTRPENMVTVLNYNDEEVESMEINNYANQGNEEILHILVRWKFNGKKNLNNQLYYDFRILYRQSKRVSSTREMNIKPILIIMVAGSYTVIL